MQLKYNELQQILKHLRNTGEFIPSVPLNSKKELLEAELDRYNEGHWTHEEHQEDVSEHDEIIADALYTQEVLAAYELSELIIVEESTEQSAALPSNNDLSIDSVAGLNEFTKAFYNKLTEVDQFYLSLNI